MESNKPLNIYQTITKIMDEIKPIAKRKKNTTQNYNFRGIDDVYNAMQPLFAKYKLFVVPEVLEQTREERTTSKGGNLIYSICKMKYTFYAEDGSNIYSIVIGEGMDSGDKASNKAMAIAMKYALFQVFCIPTEAMDDPDKNKQPQSISQAEEVKLLAEFEELLISTGTEREKVYAEFKVEDNTKMTPAQLRKAIYILKMKPKVKKEEVF